MRPDGEVSKTMTDNQHAIGLPSIIQGIDLSLNDYKIIAGGLKRRLTLTQISREIDKSDNFLGGFLRRPEPKYDEFRAWMLSMMTELNHPCLTRRIINDISRRKTEFNDEQAKKQEEVSLLLSQGVLNLTLDHSDQQSAKQDEIQVLKDELTKHKASFALMMSELEDARSRLDEAYGVLADTLHKIDYSINNLKSFHAQHESLEDKIKVWSQQQ